MSRGRSARTAAVTTALATTVMLALVALWLRSRVSPLWPALLTDWSLGSVFLALSAGAVGAVLAIRKPRNVVGWLFLAEGVLTGVVMFLRQYAELQLSLGSSSSAVWAGWGFAWLIPLNMTSLSLLLMLFPFGSPPSRRWRPLVWGVVAAGASAAVAAMVSPYLPDQTPFSHLPNPVELLSGSAGAIAVDVTSQAILIGLLIGAAALTVRVRRSRGTERQQVKWFLYSAVVAVATFIVGFWIEPLFVIATLIALPAVPVAAGVAILKYRLYDIDRVINRTVVYGAVSAVLALAYLGAVNALRALTEPVAGDTAVAVAASTLAVAALFQPVRRRVQQAVDRRFNRARYDATATVEALRSRLRDEVDLDSLKAELITVVYATMQPAGTTLWLREAER